MLFISITLRYTAKAALMDAMVFHDAAAGTLMAQESSKKS
jgi:hypothetical protein